MAFRKGYENIIEEYLIDKENNIYDFRTIDTRQNYKRNSTKATVALSAARQLGRMELSVQGGMTAYDYEEKYRSQTYRIHLSTLTPHVKLGIGWHGDKDNLALSLTYARQTVGDHDYDVVMQNTAIPHLDFQHAFSPYAYRCADLSMVAADISWQHHFGKLTAGLNAKLYLADGNRKDDASYTSAIGFTSSAPAISAAPDKHQERWGSVSAFIMF